MDPIIKKSIVTSYSRRQSMRANAKFDYSFIFLFRILNSTSGRKMFRQNRIFISRPKRYKSIVVRIPTNALRYEINRTLSVSI